MSDEQIAIEAIVAALEVVKRLKDETDISAEEVAQAVGAVGHQEMYRGLGALIYAWLQLIDEPLNLVPAVIRRVQRVGVSDEALPSVAGPWWRPRSGRGPMNGAFGSDRSARPSWWPGASQPRRLPTSSTSSVVLAAPAGSPRPPSLPCSPASRTSTIIRTGRYNRA
jgi:hypothetical protein